MASVTCLPFQVLFSEDSKQAKDMTDLPAPCYCLYLQQLPSNTTSKWEMNVFLQSKMQLYGSLTHKHFFHLQMKLQPSGISLNILSCITSWAALLYSTPSAPCSYQSSHLPDFRTGWWPNKQQRESNPVTVSAHLWHQLKVTVLCLTILVGIEAQGIQNRPHLPVSI